jgi:hypothetical protein
VIVGPRPVWIGSSAPLAIHNASGPRSFARIVVPVSRALAASVVLDTRAEDVGIFRGDAARREPALLSFSVDVVWAKSAPAPSAVGFVSVLTGDPAALGASALSSIPR